MRGAHHTTVVTNAPDEVRRFLSEVLEFESEPVFIPGDVMSQLLDWPPSAGAHGWTFGSSSMGRIEVLGIPEELLGTVAPGIVFVSLAVREFSGVVAACTEIGIEVEPSVDVANATVDLRAARLVVGGIPFEFVQFGLAASRSQPTDQPQLEETQ